MRAAFRLFRVQKHNVQTHAHTRTRTAVLRVFITLSFVGCKRMLGCRFILEIFLGLVNRAYTVKNYEKFRSNKVDHPCGFEGWARPSSEATPVCSARAFKNVFVEPSFRHCPGQRYKRHAGQVRMGIALRAKVLPFYGKVNKWQSDSRRTYCTGTTISKGFRAGVSNSVYQVGRIC